MKNYEQELYMMLAEDAESLPEDFPVKSRNRAERRKAKARVNKRRYGKTRPSREERYFGDKAAEFDHSYRAYNVTSRNNKIVRIHDVETAGEEAESLSIMDEWFKTILECPFDWDDDWELDEYDEDDYEESYMEVTRDEYWGMRDRISELEKENEALRNTIAQIVAILNI